MSNENYLTKRYRNSGAILTRMETIIPSLYFCTKQNSSGLVAIGGTSSIIQIYNRSNILEFTLQI